MNKIVQVVAACLVFLWCGVLVSRQINLSTADLGRHIKNGEILLLGTSQERNAVLHTNFYSYTNTDEPFINHHWGSGVFFYSIHNSFGFTGDSVIYVILTLLAFLPFYLVAQKQAGTAVALAVSVLVLPIVTSRKEVRPEVFTYVFAGLYYYLLSNSTLRIAKYGLKSIQFWIIPISMILWVNLHIGFIVGIGVVGIFWLVQGGFRMYDLRCKNGNKILAVSFLKNLWDDRFKNLTIILVSTIVASLISPFGLKGLLYPINIFRKYGYMIVENQSVFFLERLNITNGMYFGFFKTLVVLTAVSFVGVAIKKYIEYRKHVTQEDSMDIKMLWVNGVLCMSFTFLAGLAIRNFPLFGLFALPALAYNISVLMPKMLAGIEKKVLIGGFLVLALGIFLRVSGDIQERGEQFGVGLMPGASLAGNFYITQKIQGPLFNNYDIGGYLIYYLGGKQKVFVDNRPEAYPIPFFQNAYIPAQEREEEWLKLDKEHAFNSIFFYYHDATPWAQTFLLRMVRNPEWAPVYVDNYNLIFVRRTRQNEEIIKKFEVPKERFGVR